LIWLIQKRTHHGSAKGRISFKAEALRAQSKEFLVKKLSGLCELCVSEYFFTGNPE
jgi:hypothetical protein